MKSTIQFLFILLLLDFLIVGCNKSNLDSHKPIKNDGVAPGMVTNVQVTNKPGAAIITYDIPKDPDLQYVLAEYTLNGKATRQAKASRYGDTIIVNGFGKAGEYDVQIFAVDQGENRSQPVTIRVNPLTPPFESVAGTLTLDADFGGITVTFKNLEEEKLALVILARDHNNEFVPTETFYTSSKDGYFSLRGLDTIPQEFGIFLKDRWGNYSDTIIKTLKPIFETKLDKQKFKQYKLSTDEPAAWGWEMPVMWDDKINQDNGFHTLSGGTSGSAKPQRFTFDMGVVAKLSRFKILQRYLRGGDFIYSHGNPKIWNMYGTADMPNPDGSMTGWTLLMKCESKKPSNLPLGSYDNADLQYLKGTDGYGEEFLFPISSPPVRYIRMEVIKNWSNTDFFHAYEITFWGNPK